MDKDQTFNYIVEKKKIDEDALHKANQILEKYKNGKKRLEEKIRANEQFWKMRQWNSGVGGAVVNGDDEYRVNSTPWLHACIEGRHSDAMDSFPTCNFRARQQDDEAEARMLTSIAPVVLEQNDFEQTYSEVTRYALKQGTGVFGVFWDSSAHNGLGEIAITKADLLSLYWEPGITDIQKSPNLFVTSLVDNDLLHSKYPQTENRLNTSESNVSKYIYDDNVDTSGKSVVIDWYYKKYINGKKVLHLCKYVSDVVLYSSEDDERYAQDGYYHHGLYPFVPITLYPIEGSAAGYGLIDIGRNVQIQIDLMNQAIVDNAIEGSLPRYFCKAEGGVNTDEFLDRTKRIVNVEGSVDEDHIRQIVAADLPGNYISFLQNKIEELRFCTSNQDVNTGAAPSGVTSASGLAALQETGGKNARSTNREFHRGFKEVVYQMVELFRQFYDTPRTFRIANGQAAAQYVQYSNAGLKPQQMTLAGNSMGYRVPEFDISVTVEKANPYKKMENNELQIQFYNMGLYAPQNASVALALLSHMDFEQKDDVMQTIQQNGTLYEMLLRYQQIALQLATKYDPNLAEQIAATITGGSQMNLSLSGSKEDAADVEKEHPFVERSRAKARSASQPE